MRKGISIGQPIVNNSVDDNYNPLPDIDAKYGPYSSVKKLLKLLLLNYVVLDLLLALNRTIVLMNIGLMAVLITNI